MRYRVHVVVGRGAPTELQLDAASEATARSLAEQQGYSVLALRPAATVDRYWPLRHLAPRVDVDILVEQLRDLLNAGLSVIEALQTLLIGAAVDHRPVLERLVDRLRSGEALSTALSGEISMPALLVALVQASEHTSDLPQALSRYLDHQRRVADLRHRITSVAIYPAVLLAVGMGVLGFLMLYVMPRFARIFDGMGGDLPWSARAMMAWAQWLAVHGEWLMVALGAAVLGSVVLASSARARTLATQALLAWHPLRTRLRTYHLARWYRATGLLLEGGIPMAHALQLAHSVLPGVLRPGGAAAERAVRDGLSPSQAYARADMATPVAEQLMRAAERSGEMGAALGRIAQFHEAEVTRTLERTMRAFEPVVMVLIGLAVGAVVVLMYLPIFELASALQ